MRGGLLLGAGLWWAALGGTQQPGVEREATGAVTGHVYCADTNLPARFASVALEPVEIAPERPTGQPSQQPTVKVAQTRLDGGFSVARVKPGTERAGTGMMEEAKVVKTYGWRSQPLIVQNNVTGLVVTVPESAETVPAMP